MVPALEIKKSLGMVRGKNDQIDAKRISEYGHLRRDQLKRTILPSVTLQKIKQLVTLRDRLVAQRAGYLASNKEFKGVFKKTDNPQLFVIHKKMIEDLSRHIAVVDQSIEDLIKSEPKLEEIYQLITSVKGIGPVIAAHLLVVTNCFEGFQKSRQLACYSGIAPFEKQSGISLKTRSRVSHYANKKMKTLLNLAATSAIQCDPELKAYYCRRIESGKSKMSTINIVRNKLLHRVFAVVKRKSPYVNIAKWAA
jgi:transposase